MLGLRDDIRCAVQLQAPSSVTRAASLARIQEEEGETHMPRGRPPAPTKHPPTITVQTTMATAPHTDCPRRTGNDR